MCLMSPYPPLRVYDRSTLSIATIKDAIRMGIFCFTFTSCTSLNAWTILSSNFLFTSSSVHLNCWRFCTHSKYETVTPPAFVKISGIIAIFRFHSLFAASPVTGPFAASIITLQFSESTFDSLIALPSAAGIKKSHSKASNSSFDIFLPCSNPSIVLFL